MDLPLEVRLEVYEFALASPVSLGLSHDVGTSHPFIFQGIALFCFSRKINEEALPVFYAVNQFHFVMDENSPLCPADSSHFAKIRYISVSYERPITPKQLPKFFNKVLDTFPRIHSFCFYISETKPCPPLESTLAVVRHLRQRMQSISIIFFVHDKTESEDSVHYLLDVIRPHDEWRLQTCDHWPHFPTWRFDTPDGGGFFRVWSIPQPRCGIKVL